MKIAVGGILHDRWTLPQYLAAILQLNHDKHEVMWAWVLDGEVPPFDAQAFRATGQTVVVKADIPGPPYRREPGSSERLRRTYERLALMRNMLADIAIHHDCDALLSVDSDVIVPPDLLKSLVMAQSLWVSALVRNSPTDECCWNVFHLSDVARSGGLVQHFRACGNGAAGNEWPAMRPWDHDPRDKAQRRDLIAGAVCWYSRPLLQIARWHSDLRGRQEDIGFGIDAFRHGFTASYMPIVCRHLTMEGERHP